MARVTSFVVRCVCNVNGVVLGRMGVHICNMECGGVSKSGLDLYKFIWACVWDLLMSAFQGVWYRGFHCTYMYMHTVKPPYSSHL